MLTTHPEPKEDRRRETLARRGKVPVKSERNDPEMRGRLVN